MKITIAKTAGFCMGVRRAVDIVLDASNTTQERICTYGPLIHNPQVLEMLEEKGIPSIDKIPEKGEGTVLIRAHGVPPQDQEKLKQAGFTVIDATCPRVIRVQTIIRKHARKGYASIILGDRDHPEVRGLLGPRRFGEGAGAGIHHGCCSRTVTCQSLHTSTAISIQRMSSSLVSVALSPVVPTGQMWPLALFF